MIDVSFDKRLELIFGLHYCVAKKNNINIDWIFANNKEYNDKFYNTFKDKIPPVLEEFIIRGGFSKCCKCANVALHMDDEYNFVDTDKLPKGINYKLLSKQIQKFVEESNFEDFIKENEKEYDVIATKYKIALNFYTNFSQESIEKFFGYSLGEPTIKLLNFSAASYHNKETGKITFINGFEKPVNAKNLGFDTNLIIDFIHSYIHSYVNTHGYRYLKNVDLSNIVEEAKENGIQKEYATDITFINEYLTKAIQLILLRDYFDPKFISEKMDEFRNEGFIHLEEIIDILINKRKNLNFEIFYLNELTPYFSGLNNRLKEEQVKQL